MTASSKEAIASDARATLNSVRSDARDAAENVGDAANRAGRKIRGFFENTQDELRDVSDKVTSHVRDNPVQSSLVALGVGVILGALIRR